MAATSNPLQGFLAPPAPPLFNVEGSRFPLGAAKRSRNTCFRKLLPNIESGGRGESYSGGKDKRRLLKELAS